MSADIDLASHPHLPRGVRLRRDDARGRWILPGAERIFEIDDVAATVLQLCNGERALKAIIAELAATYAAPEAKVQSDVVAMLKDLISKRVLEL